MHGINREWHLLDISRSLTLRWLGHIHDNLDIIAKEAMLLMRERGLQVNIKATASDNYIGTWIRLEIV